MADLNELDNMIKNQEFIIQTGEKLKRLENFPEFREIITEDFLNNGLKRLMLEKADPINQNNEAHLKFLQSSIDAIGHFSFYISSLKAMAAIAEQELKILKNQKDQLLDELAEEERIKDQEDN